MILRFSFVLLLVGYGAIVQAGQKVSRGDNSQLPPIDGTKMFDFKSFQGFNREFKVDDVEMKTAHLPAYSGKFRDLPLTQWQSSKSDFYARDLPQRDFRVNSAVDEALREFSLKDNASVASLGNVVESREARLPSENVEGRQLDAPKSIQNEDLKQVINKGSFTGKVKVGRGFDARELPSVDEPSR